LPKYFLEEYKDFPREIQEKMRNLFYLCIGGSLAFGFMFIRAIWINFDLFELIATAINIMILVITLFFIRLKKPVLAGDIAICMVFYTLINLVLRDAFSDEFKQISRINDTTVELIFGLLITINYIIRKSQYLMMIMFSFFILISHFFILVFHYYSGVITSETLNSFSESLLILTCSLFFCFTILSLTSRERGQVFSNIIFYKLDMQGPSIAYSEHPLRNDVEFSSGAYFYTMIGQGLQYATGLFGPVPFGVKEEGQVALIFATRTTDSGLVDQRLQCQNYLLIALIATPDKVSILDREILEKQLKEITQDISDLCTFTAQNYANIVTQIRAA